MKNFHLFHLSLTSGSVPADNTAKSKPAKVVTRKPEGEAESSKDILKSMKEWVSLIALPITVFALLGISYYIFEILHDSQVTQNYRFSEVFVSFLRYLQNGLSDGMASLYPNKSSEPTDNESINPRVDPSTEILDMFGRKKSTEETSAEVGGEIDRKEPSHKHEPSSNNGQCKRSTRILRMCDRRNSYNDTGSQGAESSSTKQKSGVFGNLRSNNVLGVEDNTDNRNISKSDKSCTGILRMFGNKKSSDKE